MTEREMRITIDNLKTLVADQALELAKLKLNNLELKDALKYIEASMVSIGGPLNDNVHQYSTDQLKIFYNFKYKISGLIDEDCDC